MSETATVLRKAAELIEPEGAWIRDEFWTGPGRDYSDLSSDDDVPRWGDGADCFCVIGAIAHVLQLDPDEIALTHPAIHLLARSIGVLPNKVVTWNDDPTRRQDQVVQALRNAADQAEGGES